MQQLILSLLSWNLAMAEIQILSTLFKQDSPENKSIVSQYACRKRRLNMIFTVYTDNPYAVGVDLTA